MKKNQTKENYFLESFNDEIIAVHLVSRPYGVSEKDSYRQSLSYDAFKNNEDKRVIKYQDKTDILFYFEYTAKEFEEESIFLKKVSYHFHSSIWEFYKKIGYDYKTKKYI